MVNYQQLDVVFSALSDPTRRAMVQRLTQGDATISEHAEPYDKSLPAFLKHVGVLENAGLVSRTKQGRTNTLRLLPEPLKQAHDWLAEHRVMWEAQFDNLAIFLESNAELNDAQDNTLDNTQEKNTDDDSA